jgi:hypothetical protein
MKSRRMRLPVNVEQRRREIHIRYVGKARKKDTTRKNERQMNG